MMIKDIDQKGAANSVNIHENDLKGTWVNGILNPSSSGNK